MKKTIQILILFVAISLVIKYYNHNKLKSDIEKKLTVNKINFTSISNFKWEKLVIVTPYKSINELEKDLNVNLSSINIKVQSDDSINLLIFLDDSKSVKTVEISRIYGDFYPSNIVLDRKNTFFELEKINLENSKNQIINKWILHKNIN